MIDRLVHGAAPHCQRLPARYKPLARFATVFEQRFELQAQALQRMVSCGVLRLVEAGRNAVMNGKSLLIGALVVGVAVLGYLYWDSQENTVLKVPGVTIKKN
jgi:hypothetical protein